MRTSGREGPVDDVGKPFDLSLSGDAVGRLSLPSLRPLWLLASVAAIACLVQVAVLFSSSSSLSRNVQASLLALLLAMIGTGVFIWMRARSRFTHASSWDRVHTVNAWLAAHRHCGACGCSLHAVGPNERGFVYCPKCGCAWHQDRFTMAKLNPQRPPHSVEWHSKAHNAFPQSMYDDRRVPFDGPPTLSLRWQYPPAVPEHCRTPFDDRVEELEAIRRGRGLYLGFVVMLCVMVASSVIPAVTGASGFLRPALVLGFGIPFVFVMRAWHRAQTALIARSAALFAGFCPHCHTPFSASALDSTFDGCSGCSGCGRAWRSEALRVRPGVRASH